jgi:hypothetical protein
MAEQTKALKMERMQLTKGSRPPKTAGRMKPLETTKQTRPLWRAAEAMVLKMVVQQTQAPKMASWARALKTVVYGSMAPKTDHLTWNPVRLWQVAKSAMIQRQKTRQSRVMAALKENQKAYQRARQTAQEHATMEALEQAMTQWEEAVVSEKIQPLKTQQKMALAASETHWKAYWRARQRTRTRTRTQTQTRAAEQAMVLKMEHQTRC